MFIVRCNKCGHEQKTNPDVKKKGGITSKVKRCVYCGHSFRIHSSIDNTRIVKEIKNIQDSSALFISS